ncbi:MAG: sigma-70 family RNA polymerase sigma factor [Mediterranea sp.]|jgi:RNA polymerase sigma factor (sigma-70 family)|nr:sigma-70 family RNA polymerase sigma factor [Mediterranea sp.]
MEQQHHNPDSLWNKYISGDDDAYADLYHTYVQVLFAYALRYTSDRELAKDCLQELFVKLFRHRSRLKPTDNVKSYLLVIFKNILLNAIKKEEIYQGHIHRMQPDEVCPPADLPEIHEEMHHTARLVDQSLECLSRREREIMKMRYQEEKSLQEIATLTGIHYQSVQNIIQRGLKKMRRHLCIGDTG